MTQFHDNFDGQQLKRLREILLSEDRITIQRLEERNQQLEQTIQQLEEIIERKELLSERVDPIIDNKISDIKNDFSNVLGAEVGLEFEKKLADSEDLILTAISPLMGKMIKKYISKEFQKLKENIDNKLKSTFSFKDKILSMIGIGKSSEERIASLDEVIIQDVIVIQGNSGIMMGVYSREDVERDIFSAMLTAIKAFGQDAFRKSGSGNQELEFVEYDNYKIFLQNHHNYYFAVVLTGATAFKDKEDLSDKLYDFAEKEKRLNKQNITGEDVKYISDQLRKYFS